MFTYRWPIYCIAAQVPAMSAPGLVTPRPRWSAPVQFHDSQEKYTEILPSRDLHKHHLRVNAIRGHNSNS